MDTRISAFYHILYIDSSAGYELFDALANARGYRAGAIDARDGRSHERIAVGRTITSHACEMWLAGRMSDVEAIDDMALRFEALCDAWREAKIKAASRGN